MNRNIQISPEGMDRREHMLEELLDEVDSHQRLVKIRKTVGRTALALTCMLMVGLVAWKLDSGTPSLENQGVIVRNQVVGVQPENSRAIERFVEQNQPGARKYIVSNYKPTLEFESISDAELLLLLESTGNPSVLGEINGKTMLIPARLDRTASMN